MESRHNKGMLLPNQIFVSGNLTLLHQKMIAPDSQENNLDVCQ